MATTTTAPPAADEPRQPDHAWCATAVPITQTYVLSSRPRIWRRRRCITCRQTWPCYPAMDAKTNLRLWWPLP